MDKTQDKKILLQDQLRIDEIRNNAQPRAKYGSHSLPDKKEVSPDSYGNSFIKRPKKK